MWCRKESVKTIWNDRAKSKVLQSVKENRNILQSIKLEKANKIGHILLRKCLLRHVTEGKKEGQKDRQKGGEGRKHCVTICGELALEEWSCRKTAYVMMMNLIFISPCIFSIFNIMIPSQP
jgi:hypothetical protein